MISIQGTSGPMALLGDGEGADTLLSSSSEPWFLQQSSMQMLSEDVEAVQTQTLTEDAGDAGNGK